MSPFKPGDRIEKVRDTDLEGLDRYVGNTVPTGAFATVIDRDIPRRILNAGYDLAVKVDGRNVDTITVASSWRKVDGPTTGITSVEQLKRSLSQPQTVTP